MPDCKITGTPYRKIPKKTAGTPNRPIYRNRKDGFYAINRQQEESIQKNPKTINFRISFRHILEKNIVPIGNLHIRAVFQPKYRWDSAPADKVSNTPSNKLLPR